MSATLDIQQPQPFDLIGSTLLIAGNATAFEGTLTIVVSEGHDEFEGFAQVGALGLRQFQAQFEIPESNAFRLNRLFVTLADDSGNAGGPSVTVPVLYGPRILPGYRGWQPYTVQPGDSLTRIARQAYGAPDTEPIFEANQHVLANPDLIFPGQMLRIPRNDF